MSNEKKPAGKAKVVSKATAAKQSKKYVNQSDVPRHSLPEALRIPQAICDNFGKAPTKPLYIADALELTPNSSLFRMLCGASGAYGLTEGSYKSGVISLTDLGRRIVAPTVEGDDLAARREALLVPRIMKEFLSKYNGSKIPPDRIAYNVLEQMGVPVDATERTFTLLIRSAKEVGLVRELKGGLYGDIEGVNTAIRTETDDSGEDSSNDASPVPETPHVNQGKVDQNVPAIILPQPPSMDNNRVFITHGKNKDIVNQLKELLAFGKFEPIVAAEHETVSKPVPEKVLDDMRSCYAAIIHVGSEIKVLDQEGKEHGFLNQNVLIEIGAAMALYARRFILLVEQGVTLPSNLQGLYEVRYEGDKLDYEATMKLLRAFNDFKT